MKLNRLLVFLTLISFKINAQTSSQGNLACVQGVWAYNMNEDDQITYCVVRKNKSFVFTYFKKSPSQKPYINISIEGFLNKMPDSTFIYKDSILEAGKFYVVIEEEAYLNSKSKITEDFYTLPHSFGCDKETMWVNGGQIVEFNRIKNIPQAVLNLIKSEGLKRKRNYIIEFGL